MMEVPRPRSRRQPHRTVRGAYKRLALLLARVSIGLRIRSPPPPPPHKLSIDQGEEDRISALPDHLLLGILERLDLRDAVRAGALSRRWRHLPHRLSRLHLDVRHFHGAASRRWRHLPHRLSRLHLDVGRFHGASPAAIMEAFTAATCRLLSARPPSAPGERECAIKILVLNFYHAPDLSTLGRAVEDLVSRGETRRLEFHIRSPDEQTTAPQRVELGQQFTSFSRACPVAFRWLTKLALDDLAFGHSQVTDLITSCHRLKHLALSYCSLLEHSVLEIDAPHSGIEELEFYCFLCTRIELVSVPKLRKVWCLAWPGENPPLRFGYVPELDDIRLAAIAKAWQAPFALSQCLPRSARNLSNLRLDFGARMIWIQPEHPKHLTATFCNLTFVSLGSIFPECDLSWTLFILEAAPALREFCLCREQHPCIDIPKDSAEKTTVVWEPSKDLKHLNLKLLLIFGFEGEDKVTNYIRLVMERAVGLKVIKLGGELPCKKCDAIYPRRSQVDEARRRRIKERLTRGSSSSVEIIMWR